MNQDWIGLLRPSILCCALLFLQQAAHADLWAYVDERGVTHFAVEQIDERYALFYKGARFDSSLDRSNAGVPRAEQPSITANAAQRLTYFDISPEYKRARPHLRDAARAHGVDYELLQAVVATESGFDPRAVSPKGAVGLMQLMPATASRFGVNADPKRSVEQKLTDPATNLSAGARYLRHLIGLFDGKLELALAAYNAGEGAVQRAGNQIPAYRETRNYVKSVMGLYAALKPPEPLQAHRAAADRAQTGRVRMELAAGHAPAPVVPVTSTVSLESAAAAMRMPGRGAPDLSYNE